MKMNLRQWSSCKEMVFVCVISVSYTHLDVYKRQPQISYMHVDDTYEKCYGYTQGMKENDGYSRSSSAKGTDAGRQKKARQKELLEEYLEKRAQDKKQQLEMLNKKIAKMELERSRQTQSWNSERQMAKASNAYDANIMMEAELVKNITKGENNGNFK